MSFSTHRPWCAIALVVAAPLVLAIVELFHPHPRDLFELDVRTWVLVHYAQIPLFPLSALSMALLVRDRTDWGAWLCKAGMFVFAVAFTSFDTAAGLVIGLLVKAALASGHPEAWRDMIDALWFDPILGGKGFTDRAAARTDRTDFAFDRRDSRCVLAQTRGTWLGTGAAAGHRQPRHERIQVAFVARRPAHFRRHGAGGGMDPLGEPAPGCAGNRPVARTGRRGGCHGEAEVARAGALNRESP
jgi:hypothetical protein